MRAPVDLVYGTPEMARLVAYATYADEQDARMRQAYTLVCENLGVAAKCNKRAYDLRVHAHTYKVGEWVRYFHPRKMANRQDKWRRKAFPHGQGYRASTRYDSAQQACTSFLCAYC